MSPAVGVGRWNFYCRSARSGVYSLVNDPLKQDVSLVALETPEPSISEISTLPLYNIEYGIFGKGSQISTNQRQENGAFSLLIG